MFTLKTIRHIKTTFLLKYIFQHLALPTLKIKN